MDRRVFLALGVLAAAAGSEAFAAQVRLAGEKGQMLHVDGGALVKAIYQVALSRDGVAVGTRALTKLGHNPAEARQMTRLAISIVRKCGSYDNFLGLAGGKAPDGVKLDSREMALLRRVGVPRAAAAGTWEGSSGRTWEGSALAAPRPGTPGTVWDGRTWEGHSLR
jgi:hypothetical protein